MTNVVPRFEHEVSQTPFFENWRMEVWKKKKKTADF
jgi:hypothetical protein